MNKKGSDSGRLLFVEHERESICLEAKSGLMEMKEKARH